MTRLLFFISIVICLPVFSQVYVLNNGIVTSWSDSPITSIKENSESFLNLETAIKAIQKEELICMVDSLVLQVQVDQNGKTDRIDIQFSLSKAHAEYILSALRTCHFAPNQKLELLFLFKPKFEEPSVFDLQKTPKTGACWRNGNEGNLLFDVSCFNYHVTEKVFDVLNKLRNKNQVEEGPLTGTIWFNKHGKVQQIELNSSCFNPWFNDLAVKSLASLKIKKGAAINNQDTGFYIDIQAILLISNNTDTSSIINNAENMFIRNSLDSAMFYYSLANARGAHLLPRQLNELGYAYDALGFNGLAQKTWQQNIETDFWEYLVANRSKNSITLEKRRTNIYPTTFETCTGTDTASAYICLINGITYLITKELNGQIKYVPYDRNIIASFQTTANGDVKSIRINSFSLSRKNNLLAIKALSKLPKLVPAQKNNKKVPMNFSVPINILKAQ